MQFVVIDFEATCDEPYNPNPQEIIEFPAVLVDPQADAKEEFHTYVRPVAHPQLRPFCARLTGIRQEQVDRGPTFPEVLEQFEAWLRRTCRAEVLLVACGDWDLSSLLPRQCAQHHLPVPAWADRWADIKRLFAAHFPHASERTGLPDMAEALRLRLVGRLHSGIHDARNIAAVLRALLQRGVMVENNSFWRCLGCGAENLQRVRECGKCGRSRFVLKPGDWSCPRCGFANFATRDRCFDCGVARPAGPDQAVPAQMKPGDWLCGKCGGHNFARRRSCYACGSARW